MYKIECVKKTVALYITKFEFKWILKNWTVPSLKILLIIVENIIVEKIKAAVLQEDKRKNLKSLVLSRKHNMLLTQSKMN